MKVDAIERHALSATAQTIFFQLINKAQKTGNASAIAINELSLADYLHLPQKDFHKAKKELLSSGVITVTGSIASEMYYTITKSKKSTPPPAVRQAPPEQDNDMTKLIIMNSPEYQTAQRILAERSKKI